MSHINKIYSLMRATTLMGAIIAPAFISDVVAAQDKGVGDLKPISDWSVQPMAQNTDNAYCALSRQYNQDLVLTLGQSTSEEYSLAIDFLDASLNTEKAYDVTLQPGPGQIRAYQMMPASARAMVVRIGFDASFMNALEQSGSLKAEIEGKNYVFEVTDFSQAQENLKSCMRSLKGATSDAVANNDFKAQKLENVEALDAPAKPNNIQDQDDVVKPSVQAPKKTVSISKAVQDDVAEAPKENRAEKEPASQPPISIERISRAVDDVQPELPKADKPTAPIVMSKVSSQMLDKEKQTPTSILPPEKDQRAKAEALMQEQAQAAEKAQQREKEIAAQKAQELERQAQEMARQQEAQKAEKQRLAELKAQKEAQKRAEAEKREAQRIAEEKKQTEVKAQELAKFKEENERLARSMEEQQKKLESLDRSKSTSQTEINEIKARMKELEEENRKLYLEARQARAEIDKAVVNTSNEALVKMREYEEKLNAARADNIALSKEIEEMRRLKEDGSLQAAAGDWDLERATQRYNEAEREIKRLGLLLEQQRVVHRKEKAELEQMLFDPVVTDKEQRRRLTELELKLEAAERQLAASGQRIKDMNSMPAMPASPVASMTLNERVGLPPLSESVRSPLRGQENDNTSVLAAVRAEQEEINRLNNQIKQEQRQARFAQPQVRSIPRIEDTPTSISARPALQQPTPPPVSSPQSVPAPILAQTNMPSQQLVSKKPTLQTGRTPVASVKEGGIDKDDVRDVLLRSGLTINGDVNQRGPGQYQWISGDLSGQAQVVSADKVGGLEKFVASFMGLSKKACKGDFASLPAPDVSNGKAYEVACITPQSNMSSSLIFKQRGSEVIVIGHEISTDDMDVAMDIRDRIAENL